MRLLIAHFNRHLLAITIRFSLKKKYLIHCWIIQMYISALTNGTRTIQSIRVVMKMKWPCLAYACSWLTHFFQSNQHSNDQGQVDDIFSIFLVFISDENCLRFKSIYLDTSRDSGVLTVKQRPVPPGGLDAFLRILRSQLNELIN